ncbi:stage III sporulation protein AF [Desulfothermobacter acidiphilus]|uniref:stage III sporulation protein AF n=1 Tax=Desulfothermobacter acidiphilus TaxID=1938353 RepID=UPI003F88A7CF
MAELVRNLTLLVVLAAVLELWLPAGDMRRYVRLVAGLLLVAAVVQAILGGWRSGFASIALPPVASHPATPVTASEWQRRAEELYQDSLARQVQALARLAGLPVDRVEVVLERECGGYPRLRELKLHVSHSVPASTAEEDGKATEALKTLADFYNMEPRQITLMAP